MTATPPLTVVDETTSTNDVVRGWMERGQPHGCALLARQQTAGRGRHGRTWRTVGPDNLHLSVGIRDPRLQRHTGQLPLVAGVAVAQVLDPDGVHGLALKWPNDLYVADRKLGGILCEGVARGTRIEAAVVGIGLNLLGSGDAIPEPLRDQAVTWESATGQLADLETTAAALRARVLELADHLFRDPTPMLDAWRQRDWLRGNPVQVAVGDRVLEGVADGIGADGALHLRMVDGEVVAVRSGDVQRVRPT